MKKVKRLNLNKKGFTLVELMVVVAIIGILSTIAVPQFRKFQARAKQSEVRLTLGSLHTLQSAVHTEFQTYTGCLGSIGFQRDGNKFYYAIGFHAAGAIPNNACGALTAANQDCLTYSYSTPGGVSTPVAACADGADQTFFLGTVADAAGAAAARADLPAGGASGTATIVGKNAYIIGAAGRLGGGAAVTDNWTLSEAKDIVTVRAGL